MLWQLCCVRINKPLLLPSPVSVLKTLGTLAQSELFWTSVAASLGKVLLAFVLAVICPIVAVVMAIAKEVHDERTEGNHWCWKDIVADVAGVVLGSVVHGLILLLIL